MADQDDEVRVVDGMVDVVAIRDRRGAHVHLIPWAHRSPTLDLCTEGLPLADELPECQLGSIQITYGAEQEAEGCALLSMTPLPIMVSQNGMPISSTNCRSMLDVSLRFAPAPITSSGWLHACAAEGRRMLVSAVRQISTVRRLSLPSEWTQSLH